MHRRQTRVVQLVLINVTVPLISMCVTFILLYMFMPHAHYVSKVVDEIPMPYVVHDAPVAAVILAPVQLRIDKITVIAEIKPVGLTTSGDMDIEEDPEGAAWYKLGPKPGEEGSAVIAGHYGWKGTVPSVFNDLNKLVKGDTITTVDQEGQSKVFVVSRIALYDPKQDATNVFKSDDGKAHLNLITCQGSWNNSERTYSERLVVFTDLL